MYQGKVSDAFFRGEGRIDNMFRQKGCNLFFVFNMCVSVTKAFDSRSRDRLLSDHERDSLRVGKSLCMNSA